MVLRAPFTPPPRPPDHGSGLWFRIFGSILRGPVGGPTIFTVCQWSSQPSALNAILGPPPASRPKHKNLQELPYDALLYLVRPHELIWDIFGVSLSSFLMLCFWGTWVEA